MTESVIHSSIQNKQSAHKALDISIKSWFAFALIGQWAFAIYIFFIYAVTLIYGLDITEFSPAPNLKKNEDAINMMFFIHTLSAIYLALFGMAQLIPAIRNKYKNFHRINGRIFLLLGFAGAATGLFLQWSKGLQTNTAASLGITLNGLLIMVAVYFSWHHAIKKHFALHKRWAIHAFILINGVWTFRLYLMGWYMINQGPNGNTPNIDGPMDITLSFACYLFPMLVAECYFWVKKRGSQNQLWSSAVLVSIAALITLIGVGAATLMMWTPRITNVLLAL